MPSSAHYFGQKQDGLFPATDSYSQMIAQLVDRLRVSHLTVPQQIHGSDVLVLNDADEWVVNCDNPFVLPPAHDREPEITDTVSLRVAQSDAVITNRAGTAVGVLTADCVPVLMRDTRTGAVAAVHAGWRGSAGGIVEHTLVVLEAVYEMAVDSLEVMIGPSARECCYEVSADFGDMLPEAAWQDCMVAGAGGYYFDNVGYIRGRLAQWGVPDQAITDVAICTMCDPAWWSHRRDGQGAGRQLSAIVC